MDESIAQALQQAAERVGRLTLYDEEVKTLADAAESMRARAILAVLDDGDIIAKAVAE